MVWETIRAVKVQGDARTEAPQASGSQPRDDGNEGTNRAEVDPTMDTTLKRSPRRTVSRASAALDSTLTNWDDEKADEEFARLLEIL